MCTYKTKYTCDDPKIVVATKHKQYETVWIILVMNCALYHHSQPITSTYTVCLLEFFWQFI